LEQKVEGEGGGFPPHTTIFFGGGGGQAGKRKKKGSLNVGKTINQAIKKKKKKNLWWEKKKRNDLAGVSWAKLTKSLAEKVWAIAKKNSVVSCEVEMCLPGGQQSPRSFYCHGGVCNNEKNWAHDKHLHGVPLGVGGDLSDREWEKKNSENLTTENKFPKSVKCVTHK